MCNLADIPQNINGEAEVEKMANNHLELVICSSIQNYMTNKYMSDGFLVAYQISKRTKKNCGLYLR